MKEKEVIYTIYDGDNAIKALRSEYEKRHPVKYIPYWTMKDGKTIKIEDMTDQHILNTIKVISHNQYWAESGCFDPNWD